MKSHKYWSIGAFLCMIMAMISGFCGKSKNCHMWWGIGSMGCMLMSVYTGHKMIRRKPVSTMDNLE